MRLLLALVLLLIAAVPARAGTYEHLSLPGRDGWSPDWWAPRGFVSTGEEPGVVWAGFFVRGPFDPGDRAGWLYAAPAGTTITGWAIERSVSGIAGGDWNTIFAAEGDGNRRLVAFDVPSVDRPWERIGNGDLSATRLVAQLVCGGPGPCHRSGPAAILRLRAASVWLHDGHAPSVSGVQGDLVSEPVLEGTAQLAFSAVDAGGGVYRVLTVVDGAVRTAAVVDADGDRCRAVGQGYRFAFRVPCPGSASGKVALDTTALSDGRHVVEVLVEDAAGNRTTAYGPAAKTVRNRPVPPPAPVPDPPAPVAPPVPVAQPAPAGPPVTVAWLEVRRRRAASVTVDHDDRVSLRGRVTDGAGRPLARALVVAEGRMLDGRGRTLRALAPVLVRSGSDGRFAATLPSGPSRRLQVALGEGGSGPRLTVRIRARATARLTGRGLVRGRLLGGHVPRGGALVELQERIGGRWRTRRVVRTYRSGRFAGRLEGVTGAVRVRVPLQAGLPYAAGLARAISPPRRGGRTARRTSR